MSEYKLVPVEPTQEMVSAAEDAYMPFGDMDLALRMAILTAPDVQGKPGVKWAPEEVANGNKGIRWVSDEGVHGRPTDHDCRVYLESNPNARGCHCPECTMLATAPQAAPAVQGEPVGEVRLELGSPSYIFAELYSKSLSVLTPGTKLYTAPQPAEQQPIPSSLAHDASIHLTNWLNMNLCECESGHTCGYTEVRRTRDALLAVAEQQQAPDVGELIEALEELMLRAHPAYVHDDLMREKLIAARELGHAALSSHREQQPAPDVAMRVMEALAAILRKAQGRTDTETGECIDVGAECMAIRREFDRSSKAARGVSGLVEAAEAALGEIEDIMQEAYNSAYPVCCGRAGSECCGSPDPEWDEADQRMMDRLAQHQKALSAALAAHRKQEVSHDQ